MKTTKVINRQTGLVEFEGSYSECKNYLKNNAGMSIFNINDELYDEDGNSNAIESN